MKTVKRFDQLIVGAGWAGMMALHHARGLGLSVHLVEAEPDVGGTWYRNRYPGLRCDIESLHYSYSFDEELQQEWTWTERYPSQPELLAYAQHVADRFELRHDISFNTRVTSMRYSDADHRWTVTCDTGAVFDARFCVMATGALSLPKPIDLSGAAEFGGESYTTTDWPREGVDFTGKRVAQIGTGSSGIQVATELAKQAGHLYVLQRTASHSMPAHNRPLEADEIAQVKERYAELRASGRRSFDGLSLPTTGKKALEVSADDRMAAYWEIYEAGSPFRYLAVYDGRPHRLRGKPHRGGLRLRPDPRHRPRPGGGREAHPDRLSVRHPEALHRQRLLRDLQPAERDARRHRCRPDRTDHGRRHRHRVDELRRRRNRVRDRLRRTDRRAPRHRHRRTRGQRRCARSGPTAPGPTSA